MPRKLTADSTCEALEDEILFTDAALRADPDAADLATHSAECLPLVDEVRGKERSLRQTVANVNAARIISNIRLDQSCQSFGRALLFELDNDRTSPRWTQFFSVSPTQFNRQPLGDQVRKVKSWLSSMVDSVLDQYREVLGRWTESADTALTDTEGLTGQRAQVKQAREQLASTLTQKRDALHTQLVQRAQERGLPREWPDAFFYIESRPKGKAASEAEGS